MPATKPTAMPWLGDMNQVATPEGQTFFDNQPNVPSSVGRGTAPAPGNFTETPAFTGNSGKLAEGQHKV